MIKSILVKKYKSPLLFLLFVLLISFVFRSLVFNLSTNLIDWYDHPFVAWVISQNIDHILELDLANIFNSNILYPYKYTLLLSENFIGTSIFGTIFYILTNNIISSVNLILISFTILNYISSYLLINSVYKNKYLAFIGSLLIVFSPIFHTELSHYQSHALWPFIFCLYFVYKNQINRRPKYIIFAGLFITIQYLTNMYNSLFLILTIFIYCASNTFFHKEIKRAAVNFISITTIFLLTSSPFIYSQIKTNKLLNVIRTYEETVQYSAHLSDYIFSNGIKSVLHQSEPIARWNTYNRHQAIVFPGFFVTVLAIIALFEITRKNNKLIVKLILDSRKLFYILLAGVGFIFSLGPRLSVNGSFTDIPLPYHLIVKYVPMIDSIRGTSRWSLLLYLSLIFLAIQSLKKIKITPMIFSLLTVLIIIEYVPLNLKTTSENYIRERDYVLKEMCAKENEVVLEIPVTHFDAGNQIIDGLHYISTTQLASTFHKCNLVNGYTSYDMPHLFQLKDDIYLAMQNADVEMLVKVVKETGASIISYNEKHIPNSYIEDYRKTMNLLKSSKYVEEIGLNLYLINTI